MTVVADDSTFHAALRRGGGNTDGKEAAEVSGAELAVPFTDRVSPVFEAMSFQGVGSVLS